MWTRRTVTLMTALGVVGAAAAQTTLTGPAAGDRRSECEELRRFAETTHPRGREAAANAEWRARWSALTGDANALSDGAYYVRLRQALAWFEDGHTTLLPFEFTGGPPPALAHGPFALALPLKVRMFSDGAYVTDAKDEALPLLGARLMRVGALESAALVRAWARDWPGNDAWAHRWAGGAFASPAFLQALGAVTDPAAPVQVEGEVGARRVRVTLRPRTDGAAELRAVARSKTARENWTNESGNYARPLPDRRALYISLDDMGVEGAAFEAFTRDCFAKMRETSAERLVLDLRRNGGGDNFLPEALRKHIERSRFNGPGGFYVLISPMTFSAAQNLTTRLERETFAIFVGEPSGGAPNHFGDARILTTPVTGITAMVSTLAWFDSYPMDHRKWTAPDLPVPNTFAAWRDGRDAALDAALSHRADGADDDLSDARVLYYERASQRVEWRPFWKA